MKNAAGLRLYQATGEESHVVAAFDGEAVYGIVRAEAGDEESLKVAMFLGTEDMLDKQLGGDAEPGDTIRSLFAATDHPCVITTSAG